MKMKNRMKMLCGGLVVLLASCSSQVTHTNYYFDSANGNDANSGTSVQTPFKSLVKLKELTLKGGDSILLKSGTVFTEKLLLSCCGEENNPVVLGKYGGMAKPHVKGNGVDTAAVHIFNSENLVIRDLEISNKGDAPKAGLLGLWVELDKFGESHNMVIDDLYVHDVYGSTVIEKGGGIGICIQNGRDNDSILNRFVITYYIKLYHCIIATPRPYSIASFGFRQRFRAILHHVIFYQSTITTSQYNTVTRHSIQYILPDDHSQIRIPLFPDPVSLKLNSIPLTIFQIAIFNSHSNKSIIDGYAYDSDWGCRNSVFQYNLSYNNDGGFMLVIGTDGWPEDWCVNGNIETKVRYNVSINDGLRNYLTNASHKDAYFSPAMHFTGYTQNTLVENNLFYLFPKPEPQIDRTLFHFTKHDSSYGKGDVFKNNYIYAPEVTVAVKEEKAVGNQYSGNVYVGSLKTPATGFTKQDGILMI